MARRRLLRRKYLTFRVTNPEYDEVTRWAIDDGKERAIILREMVERERERRAKLLLDGMACVGTRMAITTKAA